MPPPRVRIARSGRVRREVRVLEDDHAADQVDALAVRHARHLRRLVVVAGGAGLPCEWHAEGREPDLAALVLDVELDRVQPVLRQRDVLVELPRERRERARHMDAAHLDRERTRPDRDLDARRPVGRGLPAVRAACCSPLPASVIPPASASTTSRRRPTTAARRRRFRRRTVSRRARKRSFGSRDGYSMDTGSSSVVGRFRTETGSRAGDRTRVRMALGRPNPPRACNHPQGHPRCPDVTLAPNPCRVCAVTVPGR